MKAIATTSLLQRSLRRHEPTLVGMVVHIAWAFALAAAMFASPAIAQELGGNAGAESKSSAPEKRSERPLSPEREALKRRFQQRLERLDALKDDAFIGEAWTGSIEALDERLLSADDRVLVAEENADRKELYALVSADRAKEDKKVPPRVVAERNATRKFENAPPDHLLKVSEGYWIAKRDFARAEAITRAKKAGDIGETWEGMLGLVNAHPSDDVKSLMEKANASRREIYESVAKKLDKVAPADVLSAFGKSTRDNLPLGQYYQQKNGEWEKRPIR